MQLLKLVLLLLSSTLAGLHSAHGAPLGDCAKGQYRTDLELCVQCPSLGLRENPEKFLRSFAQRHPECPYEAPDAGLKGLLAIKATLLTRSEGSSERPSRELTPSTSLHAPTHAPSPTAGLTGAVGLTGAAPKTTPGSPSRKLSEPWSWLLPLIFLLAVAAVIFGICCVRRIRAALVSCLKRANHTSTPSQTGGEKQPLNDQSGQAHNQDDGGEAPNDQNGQAHNQADRSEALEGPNRQGPNQSNQRQSELTSSSEPEMTNMPHSPRVEICA